MYLSPEAFQRELPAAIKKINLKQLSQSINMMKYQQSADAQSSDDDKPLEHSHKHWNHKEIITDSYRKDFSSNNVKPYLTPNSISTKGRYDEDLRVTELLESQDEQTRVTEIVKRRTAVKDFHVEDPQLKVSPRNNHREEHIYVGGPQSKKLYDEFRNNTLKIANQYKQDYQFSKINDQLEDTLKDHNFDEHLSERVDLQRFHQMQNDKKRYLIEDIVSKNIEKRSLEEKKFFTWHLKFNIQYFKQYTHEHLSILTEKFGCHLGGKLTQAQCKLK